LKEKHREKSKEFRGGEKEGYKLGAPTGTKRSRHQEHPMANKKNEDLVRKGKGRLKTSHKAMGLGLGWGGGFFLGVVGERMGYKDWGKNVFH